MDFDYYQIKGKWNAATLNRRAEKLEEAQAAADELEEAGAAGVEIIGVKAGKRETIRGKKKAPKAAKTPKAKKAPATKKKAAKATKKKNDKISKMSADDLRAIDSIFSHDGKIKILKTNTPKREPAGQLDLFKQQKKFKIQFTKEELDILRGACHLIGWLPVENYIDRNEFIILQKTLYDAGLFNEHKIELKNNEIAALCILIEKKMNGEPNPFINEKLEKLRKQLESFVI
jgi:hypothetical protein